MTRRSAVRCLSGLATAALLPEGNSQQAPHVLQVGGATLDVVFLSDRFDLPPAAMLDWVQTGAGAVTAYFGRFPVPHARVEIALASGQRRGGISGTTWGDGATRSRITVGQHVTARELSEDWVMTHEMVHYGFPSMVAEHHWIEEGSATYVEPIARALVGNYRATQVWDDMLRLMPQGLPAPGDEGLDRTHTWGRTYWGGAIFCLLADVRIRQHTREKKGLVDALRAINRAGGNVEVDWPIERALRLGDKATGGKVLMTLYREMAASPMPVDLADLWKQLGVRREGREVIFDSAAPLAAVRQAISS